MVTVIVLRKFECRKEINQIAKSTSAVLFRPVRTVRKVGRKYDERNLTFYEHLFNVMRRFHLHIERPIMSLLHIRPFPIAMSFCLSSLCHVVHCGQTEHHSEKSTEFTGVEQECALNISIGTIFDLLRPTITPNQLGQTGGCNLALKLRPNGARQSKTLYWQVLGCHGWAFDWQIFPSANSPQTPHSSCKGIREGQSVNWHYVCWRKICQTHRWPWAVGFSCLLAWWW